VVPTSKKFEKRWPRTRRCFNANAFQLCFRICHSESPGKPVGLKLNGAHQLLVYADDVNLLDDNINIIKRNTRTFIDASKVVGLEINTKKSKYMLLSCHQNAGQNHDIKRANRSFENVEQFRYLGTTVTSLNLIQEKLKRGLTPGNAYYHSVQNLLFSRLLSKNVKLRIYRTIILPVVMDGCETWPLTLRGEHRLRLFENSAEKNIWTKER
jgi:hypothetical protein